MAEVVKGLNGKHDDLYANGLHIAGERYVLTKVEDENKVLYARKVRFMFSYTISALHITVAIPILQQSTRTTYSNNSISGYLYTEYMLIFTTPKNRAEMASSSAKPSKQSS